MLERRKEAIEPLLTEVNWAESDDFATLIDIILECAEIY